MEHGNLGGLFESGIKTKPGDTYYYGFQGPSPYFNMASTGSWNDNDADESTYVIGTTIMLLVSGGVRLRYNFGRSTSSGGIATFAKLVRNGVEVWKGNLYGGQDVGVYHANPVYDIYNVEPGDIIQIFVKAPRYSTYEAGLSNITITYDLL